MIGAGEFPQVDEAAGPVNSYDVIETEINHGVLMQALLDVAHCITLQILAWNSLLRSLVVATCPCLSFQSSFFPFAFKIRKALRVAVAHPRSDQQHHLFCYLPLSCLVLSGTTFSNFN